MAESSAKRMSGFARRRVGKVPELAGNPEDGGARSGPWLREELGGAPRSDKGRSWTPSGRPWESLLRPNQPKTILPLK